MRKEASLKSKDIGNTSTRLGLQKNVSRLATASKIVTHHFPLKMKPKIRDSSRFHWDSSEVIWRKFRLKLNPIRFRNIPVFSITDKLNAKSYPEIYFSFYNTNSCIATVTWRYINRKIVLFLYTDTAKNVRLKFVTSCWELTQSKSHLCWVLTP